MSIQSSVNALVGTIGAVKTAHDVRIMKKAKLRTEEQKLAIAEQRANVSLMETERKSTPLYQQTEYLKAQALLAKNLNEKENLKGGK